MRCSNAFSRVLLVSLSRHLLDFLAVALFVVTSAKAQNANPQPNANVGLPPAGILNLNGNGGGQNSNGNNGNGAGANADFDSLIDLITSTVANESWAENGGGQAEIRPFPTGVMGLERVFQVVSVAIFSALPFRSDTSTCARTSGPS